MKTTKTPARFACTILFGIAALVGAKANAASAGSVVAWGEQVMPIVQPGTRFSAIAAGGWHSLALTSDGTVVAWGNNSYGQSTVPSGLSGMVAIAAEDVHSLALKSDGTVVAWGDNYRGQSTVPSGLSGVVAIAAGGRHSLAMKSDGTVVAWGNNWDSQSTVPSGLSGVVAVAAGGWHNLALKSDGTVVAWGDNYRGQSTVPSGLSGVVAIAAGGEHSLALKSDGTVVAWGDNRYGQSTVPTGLSGVVAIAAGERHSLALVRDGPQNQAPVIVGQPASRSVHTSANASFSVLASGTTPLHYQWRKNEVNLPGATASTLTLNSVGASDVGSYSVVVSNPYGAVTSESAQLVVVARTERAPTADEAGASTIPTDNRLKVFNDDQFVSGAALNPSRMTIAITHGWRSNPEEWAEDMARLIVRELAASPPNIVAWDWRQEASAGLGTATRAVRGQGRALGQALLAGLGNGYAQKIHFMGHSLGTLVNAGAADYLHANGYAWQNTQMTLFDEAELAELFTPTAGEMVNYILSALKADLHNEARPAAPYYFKPLPEQAA